TRRARSSPGRRPGSGHHLVTEQPQPLAPAPSYQREYAAVDARGLQARDPPPTLLRRAGDGERPDQAVADRLLVAGAGGKVLRVVVAGLRPLDLVPERLQP